MERIKEALEKAARSRAESIAAAANMPAAEKSRQTAGTGQSTDAAATADFEFSETRTVDTDPLKLAERRVVALNEQDSRAQIFRMLRTQVLRRMREKEWRTMAITAPDVGNGKSMVAVNLAISMAMELNQTVLLVDVDLRRPSLHEYFGFSPEHGLSDYFSSEVPLSRILVSPSIERLVILPGKGVMSNSSEILSSPKMVSLAQELKTRYPDRFVIYDLPPLLAMDDALAFFPNVDCTLFVVEEGNNTEDDVKKSLQLLKATRLLGTVLNKVKGGAEPRSYY